VLVAAQTVVSLVTVTVFAGMVYVPGVGKTVTMGVGSSGSGVTVVYSVVVLVEEMVVVCS
jgi:hypothetical protein